jgi:hypothetical protein
MKIRYLLASSMTVLFSVSHMLPALKDDTGFACFRWCVTVLLDFDPNEIFGWLYYGGFAISNIAFAALTVFAFTKKDFPAPLIAIIILLNVHVASWPLLIACNSGDIGGIRFGYYVWLSAYVLLTYTSLKYRRKNPVPKQAPENLPMAGAAHL